MSRDLLGRRPSGDWRGDRGAAAFGLQFRTLKRVLVNRRAELAPDQLIEFRRVKKSDAESSLGEDLRESQRLGKRVSRT